MSIGVVAISVASVSDALTYTQFITKESGAFESVLTKKFDADA